MVSCLMFERTVVMNKRLWFSWSIIFVVTAATLHVDTGFAASEDTATNQASSKNSPLECWNPDVNIPLSGKTCGKVQDLQLSCYVPTDIVQAVNPPNFNVRQRSADIFSWQEFIALNWPAKDHERGVPDWHKKISDAGTRVWETWKEEYEVYLKDGAHPAAWNEREKLPESCDMQGVRKHFFRMQKID